MKRIAFVGQPEYFRSLYEEDLNTFYEVREFRLVFEAPWYYYRDLVEFNPDIAFFFRPECYPEDLLKRLKGVKIALSSEPVPFYLNGKLYESDDLLYRFNLLKEAKNKFDKFYHYCEHSIPYLAENGFKVDGEFVFPVATGTYKPGSGQKKWDVFFSGKETPHRNSYLKSLQLDYKILQLGFGVYGDEYVRLASQCKIGLNLHTGGLPSFEHRVQNMMACGMMVMSETLLPNNFFIPGKDYVEFKNEQEFWEKFNYYLNMESEREIIARNGLETVKKKLDSVPCFKRLIEAI